MTFNDLYKILLSTKPSELIKQNEQDIFQLIPDLKKCKGFNQNSVWHPYDVYEHILHVIDNVESDLTLRLTALFHDIGKPDTYTEDEKGGHFYNHWIVSQSIFNEYSEHYNIPDKKTISLLIYYHDYNVNKLIDSEVIKFLTKEEIIMLFKIKRADLLAQNSKYHYLLDEYDKIEKEILNIYEEDKSKYINIPTK